MSQERLRKVTVTHSQRQKGAHGWDAKGDVGGGIPGLHSGGLGGQQSSVWARAMNSTSFPFAGVGHGSLWGLKLL